MKITALQPQEHHPERINLFVDDRFRCGLAAEIAFAAGLRVGDEIDEESLAALERRDLLWKTREAAFNLLAYRSRTEAELRRRLLRKGYPTEIVEECLSGLVASGLVDDGEFAVAFVRDRVRSRPRGTRRLVQELRVRGVADEAAREAVDRVLEAGEVSELDLARKAAEGWARRTLRARSVQRAPLRDEDPLAMRRRLHAFLARRGFGGEAIRVVSDEVLRDPRD